MLAPKDLTPAMLRPLAANQYDWRPETQPERSDYHRRQFG